MRFFQTECALTFEIKAQDYRREYLKYLENRNVDIDWTSTEEADGLETAKRHYLLENIAHLRCLSVFVAATSQDHQVLRTEIASKLKVSEMWHHPWTDLVNLALPADGDFSQIIVEGITPLGCGQDETTVSATVLSRAMLSLLQNTGLTTGRRAWLTTYELSLLALLSDHQTKRYYPQKLRREAEDMIRRNRNPYPHPGWSQILDKYFPHKWTA